MNEKRKAGWSPRVGRLVLPVLAAFWLPLPGFVQDAGAQETGQPAAEAGNTETNDAETGQSEDRVEDEKAGETDPRVLAREEQARRERIESLSRRPSQLPTEGRSLTSTAVPAALSSQQGVRFGRSVISPSAFLGATYTDNANNTETDREEDVLFGGTARLRVDSLLRRHALGAEASVTAGSSLTGNDDDVFGWEVGADGRYDLSRQSAVGAAVSGSLAQEADSSNQADGTDAEVNDFSSSLGYQFTGRRLDYALNVSADRADFSGEDTADRDFWSYGVGGRVVRLVNDRLALFVAPQYTIDRFDEVSDDDGIDRDSAQLSAVVGADYQPRPRLTLGAALGYSETFFEDPDTDDQGEIIGSLSATYSYDPRTDVGLVVSRQTDVTTADDAASETVTAVGVDVIRLLSSERAVNAAATYAYSDFSGADRTDHGVTASLGYFHRLNDYLLIELGYQFQARQSDIDNNDFYENQVRVGMNITY
ncbi:MAG: outer membrane beta-barrel protein [Alphaproteobacteria bacterium]